jgi:hypothetical protein
MPANIFYEWHELQKSNECALSLNADANADIRWHKPLETNSHWSIPEP